MPMKKKSRSSSLKKPSQGAAMQQAAKRVPRPAKFGKEIEDIFGERIKLKPKVQTPERAETNEDIAKKKRRRNRMELNNNPASEPKSEKRTRTELDDNPGSEPRRQTRTRTELDDNPGSESRMKIDGLKIFKEDEIGFNKANSGGTRLCPFDCNCCF
ncbi:hypothetical protein CARUB_v10002169mg [Capsella rubella]|uniref:DUF1764 domain-containing protein n=1 Tax=Capsella rubella TaxID=81985 RepID=R0FI64_9BRAS|nr:uncharacterized protein C6G9.01c [Capsella rubella]XP_023636934.1 uncharacterized protein C6G9.01c [Capsella rubella]XP_023636935.1 uncharacterized protein C6G9.01c [Capsella rubella]EOA21726.1 hypothetical protein CARUB_v10002169mg [Capsella rubella]EOA21727.1 hypothetical protein CARUB_v10002169mg [Capsella rubella]